MTIEEIRNRKEELGLSAAALAELAQVPLGTLQKILSGETKCPRYATRIAIEKVLAEKETNVFKNAGGFDTIGNSPTELRESTAEYAAIPKKQGEYTLDDYYAWPEDQRIELIDGVIYEMSAPTFIHQRFAFHFAHLVQSYIDKRGGDCIPMVSPVDVKLDCDNRTMIQPDVLILCDKSKIRKWGIEGAPDFILEVLSESTRKKDLTIKMRKYINAGVKEYWILDPRDKKLYVYDFRDEGIPGIYPLSGEVGVRIYDEELKICLDDLAAMFEDLPKD